MDRKITVLCLLLISTRVDAAPSISAGTGTIANGQSITISGSGFGSGPTIEVYDEFEGTNGSTVSMTATVGSWTSANGYPATYTTTEPHMGTSSMSTMNRATTSYFGQVRKVFPAATEMYVSYNMQVPPGKYFPGATEAGSWATATGGSFKPIWITDSGVFSGDNNQVIPNWSGSNWLVAFSNDDTFTQYDSAFSAGNWWTWGGWVHVETWLKAGADPDTDAGTFYLRISNGSTTTVYSGPTKNTSGVSVPLFTDNIGNDIPQFTQINVPGAPSNTVSNYTEVVYDNVYVSAGANSAARVVLGNASTYSACTRLAIATPTSWSDTSINATVRGGEFSIGDSVYLFVVDSANTPSAGYGPLTLGAGSGSGLRRLGIRVSE